MSKKLTYMEKRWECPCGKGEVSFSYDRVTSAPAKLWSVEILCPECNERYIGTTDGNLIPLGYPEYRGNKELKQKIEKLSEIIRDYDIRGKGWSESLTKKRKIECFRAIKQDGRKLSGCPTLAFHVALRLHEKFTKEELEEAYNDILGAGCISRLETEAAKTVAEEYEKILDYVVLSKIVLPIYMAVCNYENFSRFAEEDKRYIESLKEELNGYIEEYNKSVPEYEAEKRRHIVRYEGWKNLVKSEDLRAP